MQDARDDVRVAQSRLSSLAHVGHGTVRLNHEMYASGPREGLIASQALLVAGPEPTRILPHRLLDEFGLDAPATRAWSTAAYLLRHPEVDVECAGTADEPAEIEFTRRRINGIDRSDNSRIVDIVCRDRRRTRR
jgi:hypothetical protein